MPWPQQREDAADWMRQVDRDQTRLYTDAHSGPGRVAHIPMYPATPLSFVGSTSGVYEIVWQSSALVVFPRLQIEGQAWADGGSGGDLRFLVDGAQVGGVIPISDAFVEPWAIGPEPSPSGAGAFSTITIEARVTSGGGLVHVGVVGLMSVY